MEKPDERHLAIYGNDGGISKRWELAGTEKQLRPAIKLALEHPPKERFIQNPYPKVIFGDWDTDIVKIDFDNLPLHQVKRWCKILNVRYGLDGFIILESSSKQHQVKDQDLKETVYRYRTKSYHAVFNRPVSMIELNRILAWLCLSVRSEDLTKWFFMQLQKGTYTLRIGFKSKKKPPRIVYQYGNQEKQIAKFLSNRAFIHSFLEENGACEKRE